MVALLVFIVPNLDIVFGRKKLFDITGPFGDNVIKNLARYILTLSLTLKYPVLTCHNTFEFFTSLNLNVSMENVSEFTYRYQITFPPFFLECQSLIGKLMFMSS